MSPTRQFLLDLAATMDAAERVNRMEPEQPLAVVISLATAELIARRARALAGGPTPPLVEMPSRTEALIRAEFRPRRAA